jgi:hypothetical protein
VRGLGQDGDVMITREYPESSNRSGILKRVSVGLRISYLQPGRARNEFKNRCARMGATHLCPIFSSQLYV